MSEQSTTAVPPAPAAAPVPETPRARLRDHTLGLPLVGVVAVVCLLVGGGIGTAIGYAAHSEGDSFRGRPGFGGAGGANGQPGPGGGQPAPPNGQQLPQQPTPSAGS